MRLALKKPLKTQIKAYTVISKTQHSPKKHRAATFKYKANYFYICDQPPAENFLKKKLLKSCKT